MTTKFLQTLALTVSLCAGCYVCSDVDAEASGSRCPSFTTEIDDGYSFDKEGAHNDCETAKTKYEQTFLGKPDCKVRPDKKNDPNRLWYWALCLKDKVS